MAGLRLSEDEMWAYVTDAHTGIMTTLRRDGSPVALPLWFAVVDRSIYTRTRGKKLARITNDSRSSFLVEGGEKWAELKAVHVSGSASIVEPDDELTAAFEAEMERKYKAFGTSRSKMPSATARHYATTTQMVRFLPEGRIVSWDNAKLVQG